MSNYMVLFYDKDGASASFDRQTETDSFAVWMNKLQNIVDRGAPFTAQAKTLTAPSSATDGTNSPQSPNGYCILSGSSIEEVQSLFADCPIFSSGGSVEIREIFSV